MQHQRHDIIFHEPFCKTYQQSMIPREKQTLKEWFLLSRNLSMLMTVFKVITFRQDPLIISVN